MNLPQDYFRAMTRHAVDLKRYENGLSEKINGALLDVEADILAKLMRIDPPQGGRSAVEGPLSFKTRRLQAFLAEARTLLGETFGSGNELATGELRELAKMEVEFAAQQLERAVDGSLERAVDGSVEVNISAPVINERFLRVVVDENPITGLPMTKWWDKLEAATGLEFERRLTIGLIQGETIDQLVARVRGTKANGYNDGILRGGTRRGAEMLVRTAVNRVSNAALNETWKANGDITKKYRYIATLDGRTSKICIALDGKEWEYDAPGSRLPPQHPNCRSSHIPVIDWEGLGVKPRYRPDPGMRASKEGPVEADLTYGGWLKSQPAEFQDDVLGPTRGKLFRDGKIGVNDLVRSDNRTITLEELRKRNLADVPLKVASGGGRESGAAGGPLPGESRILAFKGSGDEKKALATRLGFGHERAVDTVLTQVNKGITDGVEYSSLITLDGELASQTKGMKAYSDIMEQIEWIAANKSRQAIHVHNHIDGSSLSAPDVGVLGYLKRMVLAGHDGSVFKMSLGNDAGGKPFSPATLLLAGEIYKSEHARLLFDSLKKYDDLVLQGMGKEMAENMAMMERILETMRRINKIEFRNFDGKVYNLGDVLNYESMGRVFKP